MSQSGGHALIVGAGLAGSLLACYLARGGWRVSMFERRSDPRAKGYVGGRSINLALSVRGLWGLAGVGLDDRVMARDAISMPGRMIHPPSPASGDARVAEPIFQPYSKDPRDAINSVSRGGLNVTLLDAAEEHRGVTIAFDHACLDIDLDAPACVFQRPDGSTVRVEADLVLGADGAFSALRQRLQKVDRFEYSQSYLGHGYKELHIPPTPAGECAMEPHALHIWPRGGAMMIALPNRDRSFTCTLFWPFADDVGDGHAFDPLRGALPREVRAFFDRHYPDASALMPTLEDDFARNPTSSLVTVRCRPWSHGGKVCILGDAAHAIVPFYGQGMNCAFEDCRVLAECLVRGDGRGGDLAGALDEFQRLRKPNADAIADMALANFIEMRDKVGDPAFRYRKKLEQTVHEMHERDWAWIVTPQYYLVSFSTVPYAEALARGRRFDALLDRIIERVPASTGPMSATEESAWRERVRVESSRLLERFSRDGTPIDLDSSGGAAASNRGGPTAVVGGGERVARVFDLTPVISPRLGVWPGDTAMSREVLCEIERGAPITLSTLRATVHLGAHADGPNHYGLGAPSIERVPLDRYLGECVVLDAPVRRGARVSPADVRGLDRCRCPRVLIRTGTFPDPERWNEDFAGLSVELIDLLASRGVITIGIDTPSVDLQESKDLPAHAAMLRHGIAILEGLSLGDVPAGADERYELIALPLALEGFDASPVRALLRTM